MKVARVNGQTFAIMDSAFGIGATAAMPNLVDLTDVDGTTLADGDVLIWDAGTLTWVPGPAGSVSDITDLPTAETDTTLRLAPDGAGGVEWATSGTTTDRWEPVTTAGTNGIILIADTPAGTPLVFADLLQNDTQTDLLYADSPEIVYSAGDIVMTWRTY